MVKCNRVGRIAAVEEETDSGDYKRGRWWK